MPTLYALALYGLTEIAHPAADQIVAFFLLGAPFATCALAVLIDDPKGRRGVDQHFLLSGLVVTVLLFTSIVFLREAAICVFLAAPLLYFAGLIGGGLAGLLAHGVRRLFFCIGIVALPLIGVPLEDPAGYPTRSEQILTVIEIDAPPEVVWRHTTSIPVIRPEERVRTFSHDVVGVPRPISADLPKAEVGTVRQLTWTRGVHFQEVVTASEPNRRLAWTFRFAADSIPLDIDRHIDVQSPYLWIRDGDYELRPTQAGGTQLTLRTRYDLATPLNPYCAWWGRVFFNDFHRAVLHVIKLRAERDAHA